MDALATTDQGGRSLTVTGDLGICERTVKLHRTSIKARMGGQSVAELAQLAQEAGTFPKGQ